MKFRNIAIVLLAISAMIFSFEITSNYVRINGASDLWGQMIGSRLIVERNQSPYFFKWNDQTDLRYVDPTDDDMYPVSRVTLNPLLCVVLYPLSVLDFETNKYLQYVVNIVLLLFCILLIYRYFVKFEVKDLLFISFMVFCSSAWIWHCAEGQKYVIFSFYLFCVFLFFHLQRYTLSGFFSVFIVALKINSGFAIFLMLLTVLNRKEVLVPYVKGLLAGIGLCAALLISFTPLVAWKQYFQAMDFWKNELNNSVERNDGFLQKKSALKILKLGKDSLGVRFPFDKELRHNNFCISRWVFKFTEIPQNSYRYLVLYLLISSCFFLFYLRIGVLTNNTINFAVVMMIVYNLSEYFLPATRLPYHYVQWFFPTILVYKRMYFGKNLMTVFFAIGLSMNTIFLSFIPYGQIIGELFLIVSLLLFLYMQSDEYPQKYPVVSKV